VGKERERERGEGRGSERGWAVMGIEVGTRACPLLELRQLLASV
jgi:hypothetical protein